MTKVILLGPLIQIYGFKEQEFHGKSLIEIISIFDKNQIITNNNQIKPGFIILVDGIDWRIKGDRIEDSSVVTIIPVNHGG